jgi:hypothetical protein
MSHARFHALVLLVFGAVAAASCGNNDTTTSPTTTSDLRNNEKFNETLNVGQSKCYSFTTVSPGTTDVTPVSIRPSGNVAKPR